MLSTPEMLLAAALLAATTVTVTCAVMAGAVVAAVAASKLPIAASDEVSVTAAACTCAADVSVPTLLKRSTKVEVASRWRRPLADACPGGGGA